MTDLASRTILIVEDLKPDARLIARAMKKARIANPLSFVTNGQEAIDYLAGVNEYSDRTRFELPVLIILDLKLPKRDGFEVLQWIRSHEELKRVPVIVLTSSSRSPDIDRAYEAGANSYLVKPVEDAALVEMFRTLDVYWFVVNELPRSA